MFFFLPCNRERLVIILLIYLNNFHYIFIVQHALYFMLLYSADVVVVVVFLSISDMYYKIFDMVGDTSGIFLLVSVLSAANSQ